MKKETNSLLIQSIIVIVVWYLIGAFVSAEINFIKWYPAIRGFIAFLTVFTYIPIIVDYSEKIEKANKK